MNYNSIDEILNAGTSNMTILRRYTKQDNDSDIIAGADWLVFNGAVVNNIYVNGNSYLGFGSDIEHLKVNCRDTALFTLHREEGTLYNHYRFLKIRWQGYSLNYATSGAFTLVYDVILWDTGDISLHMVTVPTSGNNGTYSLTEQSTYSYKVSAASPDVTFTKTYDGFTVDNNIITLLPPVEKRYLIRSGSTYYNIVDNSLSEVAIENLTSEIFLELGLTEVPPISLLLNLENPELLYWTAETWGIPQTGLTIHVTPPLPQVIYYETQTIPEGSMINQAEISEVNDGLISITFDGGQTWKYYSEGNWITATSELEGMSNDVLLSLTTDNWAEVLTQGTFQCRCSLLSKKGRTGNFYFSMVE